MKKRDTYFFHDTFAPRSNGRKLQLCEVAARLALKYGDPPYTEEQIYDNWAFDNFPPSNSYLQKTVKLKHVKWYLHYRYTDMNSVNSLWNTDFLQGICKAGKIKWNKNAYPSFSWHGNEPLLEIMKECPFYGKLKAINNKFKWYRRLWSDVPALCLSYSDKTPAFLAGVLATGQISYKNGMCYATYNKSSAQYIKKCGIPIEYEDPRIKYSYISVIWPSLFESYMPEVFRKWKGIKKAYKAHEYAAILWRIYINRDISNNTMPYLQSRRQLFYEYKSVKELEKRIVVYDMLNLDDRIRTAVSNFFADI